MKRIIVLMIAALALVSCSDMERTCHYSIQMNFSSTPEINIGLLVNEYTTEGMCVNSYTIHSVTNKYTYERISAKGATRATVRLDLGSGSAKSSKWVKNVYLLESKTKIVINDNTVVGDYEPAVK